MVDQASLGNEGCKNYIAMKKRDKLMENDSNLYFFGNNKEWLDSVLWTYLYLIMRKHFISK